ncbi:MAG: hypothetical protein Q8O11_11035 [Syntrophales bacterium]|nr:hypothetical protein [Syntrophales bacterium]
MEHQSIVVPPLGLLYVATHLKNAGYDVRIKDAFAEGMDWGAYRQYVETEKPDILRNPGTQLPIKIANVIRGEFPVPHLPLRQVGLLRRIQKGLDRRRLFDCGEVLAEQVLNEGYLSVVSLDEDGGGGKIN